MGPVRPPVTIVKALRRRLAETIGPSIVDRRLGDRIGKGDAPFQSAGVHPGDVLVADDRLIRIEVLPDDGHPTTRPGGELTTGPAAVAPTVADPAGTRCRRLTV